MRILVIDDHPIFLAGIEFLISTRHPEHTVQAVNTAERAWEKLRWDHYHVVLLDLNLPGMDGIELLKRMRSNHIDTPTLTMSAETEAALVRQALDAGAQGFLPKSLEPNDMLNAMEAVAVGQRYLPAEVADELAHTRAATRITPRQTAVLQLIAEGLSNRDIAAQLNLTEYTVKSHVRALFHALGCKNRTACVHEAKLRGILSHHPQRGRSAGSH